MTINLQKPDIRELKPKITVFGVGGGGGNAVNNMINGGLEGVEFVCANTDAQALTMSKAERVIQLGHGATQGLGAGSQPEVGRQAAEECLAEIQDHLAGTNMAFVTAGMGGGTGTGAAPIVAKIAREMGILTVGVVTKPFQFEGGRRMTTAEEGILELQKNVDTLIVIPNQNLFRIANDKTTFADAFGMADQVLYSGVACITDLMVKEGLINLDFADVRSVMFEMGKAMMGTGEASGEGRAMQAAEAAISNPLLDETSMNGAQGLLISITGGRDMTLFEVDEAATRIREEVDLDANIIVGATFDESLDGIFRVSVVATGIDNSAIQANSVPQPMRTEAVAKTTSLLGASAPSESITIGGAGTPIVATSPISIDMGKTAGVGAPRATGQSSTHSSTTVRAPVQANGVRIEPLKVQTVNEPTNMEDAFKIAIEDELMPKSSTYVPPAATKPNQTVLRQKMPSVEDFPPMVREEMKAPKQHKPQESGPMSLLQKLRNGLGVSDNSASKELRVEPVDSTDSPAAPMRVSPAPIVNNASSTGKMEENPYAPKRGNADHTGRTIPAGNKIVDDDQLDIPAFLRRQG